MKLKEQVIRGVKWTSLSSIIIAVLQVLQISILARFLSANEFGLMAIVMVVIGFSRIFSDMGISNAIIHHQTTSHEQLSSLYWLNILAGVIIFLIITSLSPLISNFYGQAELIPLLTLLASTFIILAIGNQYRILFQKELEFNLLAKVEVFAALVAFIVAIACAVNDLGVYSLAYANIANALVLSGLFLFWGLKKHKPSLVYKHKEIRGYLNFGLFQMGDSTLNYFNSQFDIIIIGKLLGVEALGIYSVVKQLIMRPAQIINPIINRVTFPVMAKVQNDEVQLKNIYLKTINYLSSINFPIYIAIAILAEPIILIVFGEKFILGVLTLQLLSFYAMIRSTGNPIGSLIMATGHVNRGFFWNLSLFVFIPISVFYGSNYGVDGVAFALLLLQLFLMLPGWYFLVKKLCGATFIEYFKQIFMPLILVLISGFAGLCAYEISGFIIYQQILLVVLVGGSVYLLLNILFNKKLLICWKV